MLKAYATLLAKVRTAHPELPGCLWRWSRGQFLFHLSRRLIQERAYARAIPLLAEAFVTDPAFFLLGIRYHRILPMVDRLERSPEASLQGRPFLLSSQELLSFQPRSPSWLIRRRGAYCRAIRVSPTLGRSSRISASTD